MSGAGSEATSGLRERLEAEAVAALDQLLDDEQPNMTIEEAARFLVDRQLPAILEDREQAEKDTSEKIANLLQDAHDKALATDTADFCSGVFMGVLVVRSVLAALARSSGSTDG